MSKQAMGSTTSKKVALADQSEMEADPDMIAERLANISASGGGGAVDGRPTSGDVAAAAAFVDVRLNVNRSSHQANDETRRLLQEVGGLPALRRMTESFYKKAFADPQLDSFIAQHSDPHGERLSTWIAEKFGDGTPWSDARRTRKRCPVDIGHGHTTEVHDRQSAHFAAWHSIKRPTEKWGQHFNLEDSRVWMRLHFQAAREEGLLEHPGFAAYYTRFIAHFVSVYEKAAPSFARESMRWSADPANVQAYLDAGRVMEDLVLAQDITLQEALAALPEDEQDYFSSKDGAGVWPYDNPH